MYQTTIPHAIVLCLRLGVPVPRVPTCIFWEQPKQSFSIFLCLAGQVFPIVLLSLSLRKVYICYIYADTHTYLYTYACILYSIHIYMDTYLIVYKYSIHTHPYSHRHTHTCILHSIIHRHIHIYMHRVSCSLGSTLAEFH